MITLRDKETGQLLGKVSEEELQFLIDQLEEESDTDTDYYIDSDTIDMLEGNGASSTLVTVLRNAVAGQDGVEVQYFRD